MTSKSTLFIIDVEDKLSTMKCQESSDSKTHQNYCPLQSHGTVKGKPPPNGVFDI